MSREFWIDPIDDYIFPSDHKIHVIEFSEVEKLRKALDVAREAMEMGAFHHSACVHNWYGESGLTPKPCTCAHKKIDEALAEIERIVGNQK